MNDWYFIENQNEFTRVSRTHDCEIPKGDCWRIVVKHDGTGDMYEYYEEDCYLSLRDQMNDFPGRIDFSLIADSELE